MLISWAAQVDDGETVVMASDVARAFFEAPMQRNLCVELPDEAKNEGEEDMVGWLHQSRYGTRDAGCEGDGGRRV